MTSADQKLKELVEDLYTKIHQGVDPEKIKIELKSEWYKLSKGLLTGNDLKIQISKFLKELVALANTYGLEGYLIIGLGEDGKITDSPFNKSGLKDKSELYNMVVKFVDKPVRFETHEIITDIDGESKVITVIVVPPSIDKPHVISEYVTNKQTIQQYTPVRKETGIFPASRSDIDLMYYDKRNIIPEYEIDVRTFGLIRLVGDNNWSILDCPIVFENSGRKPVIIIKCNLIIRANEKHGIHNNMIHTLNEYWLNNGLVGTSTIEQRPIIVPSNNAVTFGCKFHNRNGSLKEILNEYKHFIYYFESFDTSGNRYQSEDFQR